MIEISDAAQWVAVGILGASQVAAVLKSRRNGVAEDTTLKNEVSGIKKEISDPDTGLKAIKKGQDEQSLHCMKISTNLDGRVKAIEEKHREAGKR